MLRGRNLYCEDDAITESCDGLLQFVLDLVDDLGLAANANFIRGFSLTRAVSNAERGQPRIVNKEKEILTIEQDQPVPWSQLGHHNV